MTVAVRFERVSRHFGDVRAVDDVSFEVQDGEFFAMLGPSGSGKTTSLRLIAGFDQPTSGHIEIHGSTAEGVPPYDRDVNTVFQDYALFPHMNVIDNVSYSLMVRGVDKAERHRRAEDMLALVKLGGYGSRKPAALSGGQRQRVALARALINRPKVLLLDEPLGALDLKLRESMKIELKLLQHQFGTTFVYITHDQSEALVMSDHVAVMKDGRFEQIGTPKELYNKPRTAFVAGFVGDSNHWNGRVLAADAAGVKVETETGLTLLGVARDDGAGAAGAPVEIFVRPEFIAVTPKDAPGDTPAEGTNRLDGTVDSLLFNGANSRVLVRSAHGQLIEADFPLTGEDAELRPGDAVELAWPAARSSCFRRLNSTKGHH